MENGQKNVVPKDAQCSEMYLSMFWTIPYKKLQQAEKVRTNKQMSPKIIESIIGDPTSNYPLKESRLL